MVSKELASLKPLTKIIAPVILAGGFACLGAGTIYNGIQNARNAREIDALRRGIETENSGNSDVREDVDGLRDDVDQLQEDQQELQASQAELNEKMVEQQGYMRDTRAGLARVANVACQSLDLGWQVRDLVMQGFDLPAASELWGRVNIDECVNEIIGDIPQVEPATPTPTPTPTPWTPQG